MSNLGIRTDASGTFGALTFGGVDKVTVGNNGIQAGSYAPDSITSAELAAGALIENSPAGIGYGAGAGGTVTQSTSKSTAVTLNKPCGQITTHNASVASGAAVVFTVNNSLVTAADTVIVTGGAEVSNYEIGAKTGNNGNFVIVIRNITGTAQAEAIPINFAIIKGAAS